MKRFLIYVLILFYLLCDLYLVNGPLNRFLNKEISKRDLYPKDTIATIFQETINKDNVKREVYNYLFRRGKTINSVSKSELENIERACLQNLISLRLIERKEKINPLSDKFFSDFKEIQKRSISNFGKNFNIEKETRVLKWIDAKIAIKDDEIDSKRWIERNKKAITAVPYFRTAHIFLQKQKGGDIVADVKKRINFIYDELFSHNADNLSRLNMFKDLVIAYSEDENTRQNNGSLGWVQKNEFPIEIRSILYSLNDYSFSKPIETDLGWHIIFMLEKKEIDFFNKVIFNQELKNYLKWKLQHRDDLVQKRRAMFKTLQRKIARNAKIEYFFINN